MGPMVGVAGGGVELGPVGGEVVADGGAEMEYE